MYESISKNIALENEMTLDMSYFWYSDVAGTALTYFLDSYWFWMDKGSQLHWYQLSPFAHTVAYDQIEYPKTFQWV